MSRCVVDMRASLHCTEVIRLPCSAFRRSSEANDGGGELVY